MVGEAAALPLWSAMTSWFTPSLLFLFLNLAIATIAIFSSQAKKRAPTPPPHVLARAPSLLDRVRSFDLSCYAPPPPPSHETPPFQLNEPAEPTGSSPFKSFHFSLEKYPQQEHPQPEHDTSADASDETRPELEYSETTGSARLERAPSLVDRLRAFNFSFEKQPHPEPETEENSRALETSGSTRLARTSSLLGRLKLSFNKYQRGQPDPSTEETVETRPEEAKATVAKPMLSRWSFRYRSSSEEEEREEADRRRPATVRERGSRETASSEEEGVDARADDFINRFKQQLKLQRLDSILRYREMINRGSSQ